MQNILLLIKNKAVVAIAALFLVCGFIVGQTFNVKTLFAKAVPVDMASPYEAEGADADGSQAEGNADDTESTLSDLEKMKCEHGIGIVDCDACRFEAGVVKIDQSIASMIEVGLAEDRERTKVLTFTGQVQLDRTKTVEVVSTASGRVKQVSKLLGDKVEASDTLAVIHSADLGKVKADFLEVQARLELTQATFQREKELYEKKITSQADYFDSLNALKAAEALYAAADRRLRLFDLGTEDIARIKDEKENKEFSSLILRAPQSGTIIAQNLSVGTMVTTTESLYTISDLSNLWVWCDVYEGDLALLHEQSARGEPLQARVRVKAFGSIAFDGVVDYLGQVMDEHTRTVKMRVQVKNVENRLRPGMFAEVEVTLPLPERMMAIPRVAVMSDAGKNFVFQQWKDDLWVRRDVTLGSQYDDSVEILSGIPEGATIVTGGAFMLKSDVLREKMGAGCAD